MSQANSQTKCPDADVLEDYLQGRLEPPTLDECEAHVSACDACHDTLRGLSSHDTLAEHVAGAFRDSDLLQLSGGEADAQVQGLVDRLLEQTGSRTSAGHSPAAKRSPVEAEILADRAAEVLRCVTPDPDDQTLGSIGDYQLIRLIGAGSTGVVFQATDQTLDRTVALKVLRPSLGAAARKRFMAEARLAASIEHSNVVTIYQIGQQDRLAFIAMQWLPGETLEAKMHAAATLPEPDVRRISTQVAAGLRAAHQRQLVHRDIKPANIWITDEGEEVKILDFGLARIVDEDPGLTATGMLAGTPNFMSPEQTKGHELDGRSDLFSLGCVMYRLATGKFAFGATSILGTLQAIQNEQPTPPKLINGEISDELSDLTMALLEKQPVNRPESAEQVVIMLEVERDQWPVQVTRYEVPAMVTQASKKGTLAGASGVYWRFAAAIAAAVVGAAALLFSPQIIRIATNQGELVIESDDKEVEVQILQNSQVIRVLDTKTNNAFNIESGEYQIKATGDGNSFHVTPSSIMMVRGEKTIVRVAKVPTAEPPKATVGRQAAKVAISQNESIKAEVNRLDDSIHEKLMQLQNDVGVIKSSTHYLLTVIFKTDHEIAIKLGEVAALKARFESDSPGVVSTSNHLTLLQGVRLDLIKKLPPKFAAKISPVEAVPYHADPPKTFFKGIDTLEFDWIGQTWVKQEIERGNFEEWDETIERNEAQLAAAVKNNGPTHPMTKHLEQQLAAFRKVVEHLKKANDYRAAFPTATTSQPKSNPASVVERLQQLRIARMELIEKSGPRHPTIKSVDRQMKSFQDRLEEPFERATFEPSGNRQPTFKGKPFTHWISIAANERSPEMLCDALRAGTELAGTEEERAQLLEVARTLARKFGTQVLGMDDKRDRYHKALIATIKTFEPKAVIQFVLDELKHGTPQSLGFCSWLVIHDSYGLDPHAAIARNDSFDLVLVGQAPQLLRLVVARLESDETNAAGGVLENLGQTLTWMPSIWENMGGGGMAVVASSRQPFNQKRVDWANEKNKELAPTLRELFLNSSAETKLALIRLTRAFWPSDEPIELALQADLFNPSTKPETCDALFVMILGGSNLQDVLGSSPKPISVLFLKKLLDNQLERNGQHVKFSHWKQSVIHGQPGFPRDFAEEHQQASEDNMAMGGGMGVGGLKKNKPAKIVTGRAAVIYQILQSLEAMLQSPSKDKNEEVETTKVAPLLEQILAVETTDDRDLQRDVERMKTLLIFKNAKTLLNEIKATDSGPVAP